MTKPGRQNRLLFSFGREECRSSRADALRPTAPVHVKRADDATIADRLLSEWPLAPITLHRTTWIMATNRFFLWIGTAAVFAAVAGTGGAHAASDPGKQACAQEARKLCPAEMKSFSRKRVEACMIVRINQTSPACHAAMIRIKAQREAAAGPQ